MKALKSYPEFSFVVIGKLSIKSNELYAKLKKSLNFNYLGFKKSSYLAAYLENFALCLIPYSTQSYGQSAFPVKINEYLFLGKPVVTTNLPALEDLNKENLIYLSKDDNQFLNNIKKAVHEGKNEEFTKKRVEYAMKNSWQEKLPVLIKIIEHA